MFKDRVQPALDLSGTDLDRGGGGGSVQPVLFLSLSNGAHHVIVVDIIIEETDSCQ